MNPDIIIYIVLSIVAIVIGILIYRKYFGGPKTTIQLIRSFQHQGTTPMGINLRGVPLTAEEKITLDNSMLNAFNMLRECRGYTKKLKHSDWTVAVIPSHLSPRDRAPSYFYPYPLDKEASKEFRTGGEFIINAKKDEDTIIAIANPQSDIGFAFDIMANELDHGAAFHNSQEDFAVGSVAGHVHPQFNDCRSMFAGKPQINQVTCKEIK